jgi:diguanylate cyclase (GGDEF)-like protein/PAS domain S-box-containing protein
MQKPEIPTNERDRQAALDSFNILDTLPEQEYDDLTQLAADICGTPIALISLIDRDRQWFKSRVGLDATETPRDISFCGHAVAESSFLNVPDATQDTRFTDNPLVTEDPSIRFYAGMPLKTADNFILGTLCVIDRQPKNLTEKQIRQLESLSRLVISQLELRRVSATRKAAAEWLSQEASLKQAVLDSANLAFISTDLEGAIETFSVGAEKLLGYCMAEIIGKSPAIFHDVNEIIEQSHQLSAELNETIEVGFEVFIAKAKRGGLFEKELTYICKSGDRVPVLLSVTDIRNERGEITGFLAVAKDITKRKLAEAALSKSQVLLSEAQQVAQIGSWDYDLTTGEIIWSDELFRIVGRDRNLGEPSYAENLQLYHPDDATKLHQAVDKILIDGQSYYLRLRLLRDDGSIKYVQARGQAEFNQSWQIVRLFGTSQDITELVQIENALRAESETKKILLSELQESEARYRSVIASMSEGIILQQADGEIIACNQSAERILRLSADQMRGLKSIDFEIATIREDGSIFLSEDHPAMVTLRTGQPQTNVIMGILQNDHPTKWISINSQPLFHTDQTTPYAAVTSFTDITGQKLAQEILRMEAELEHVRALTDGLTQVPNRRCFDERLQLEWQRSLREQQSLSLILIDIDYFKLYNDHYGHQSGDACLIQVAQTAASQLKRPADLFARYGGEEFVVILPNTNMAGALVVAELIKQSIHELNLPHAASKVSSKVTISLGIASIIPTQDQSPEDLIAIADRNLYQAKQQGRDRFYSGIFVATSKYLL